MLKETQSASYLLMTSICPLIKNMEPNLLLNYFDNLFFVSEKGSEGGFYDRPNFFWKSIEKFTVVAAAAPPGGGR